MENNLIPDYALFCLYICVYAYKYVRVCIYIFFSLYSTLIYLCCFRNELDLTLKCTASLNVIKLQS